MSKKPTSIRDAKKVAKQLAPQTKKTSNTSSHKKEKEITLHDAYRIIGGYTNTKSPRIIERARKMVMEVDPEFVRLVDANGAGASRLPISAEQIAQNAQTIDKEYSDDAQLRAEVVSDSSIRTAFSSTIAKELSSDETVEIFFRSAQQNVIAESVEDANLANAPVSEKHNMLVNRIKTSLKKMLATVRLGHTKNPRDAFDFSKKVEVSSSSVANVYENSYKKLSASLKSLVEKGHKKAATFINKAKTKVHSSMVKLATASVLLSSFLPSCRPNSNENQDVAPVKIEKVQVMKDTLKTPVVNANDTVPAAPVVEVTVEQEKVVTPTEWNENMGITSKQWDRLQTFWGSQEKFASFYEKISDDMLQDDGVFAGKTREQVLFQYERMSSWNLAQHQETISALDAYFGDCNGTLTKEDVASLDDILPDGSIQGVVGNSDVRVTGRDVDCAEGSTLHTVKHSKASDDVLDVSSNNDNQDAAPSETAENNEQIADNDRQDTQFVFDSIVEEGSTTILTQQITQGASSTVEIRKGNSFADSVLIGETSLDEVAQKSTSNKKGVLVEDNGNVSVTSSKTTPFVFDAIEETGSTRIIDAVSVSPTPFAFDSIEETGSTRVIDADSVASTPFAFDSIEETGSTRVITVADNSADDNGQVVEDSDDLPKGTPAAGYVDERGGYENTGLLGKRQYDNLHNWYVDKYGDNAFDDVKEKITDDMLAKGGAFEGLSAEQALRVAEGIIVHQNLFPQSARALKDYLNPCKDVQLSAEDAEQIRKDGYMITEEGLVKDGHYNKGGVWARYYTTGDCNEEGKVVYGHVAGNFPAAHASNRFYNRLFRPMRSEPFTFDYIEETGSLTIITEKVTLEANSPVQEFKGNSYTDAVQVGETTLDKVAQMSTSSKKNVLVEENGFTFEVEQTVDSKLSKSDVKKAKKAERLARREADKKKKQEQKRQQEERLAQKNKYAGGSDFVHNQTCQILGLRNGKSM